MTSEIEPAFHSPGNTYTDWYFPDQEDYSSLEWTFAPVLDPKQTLAAKHLLHFYAYNFSLKNATNEVGSGYAGFQTNGLFKGSPKGKVINYSIWGSTAGKTVGLLNEKNPESKGFQIMYPYNWEVGNHYLFELAEGPSGVEENGNWWGLWVTDKNTKKKDFVGEQLVPSIIDEKPAKLWLPHTSMFGEDLHWWRSFNGNVKYKDCTGFECSAMAAINITANQGKVKPERFTTHTNSGQITTGNNGFKSVNCEVSVYREDASLNVQHNLGYWPSTAPNSLAQAS